MWLLIFFYFIFWRKRLLFSLGMVAAITHFLDDIQLVMGDGRLFEATRHAEIKGLENNPARAFDSIN